MPARPWSIAVALFAVLACSETSDPGGSGGGGGAGAGGAAGQGANGGAELGGGAGQGAGGTGGGATCTPPSSGVVCQPITLPATELVEEIVITDQVPSATGGPLLDGEYELEAHRRYRSVAVPDETPTRMRAALRVRDGATALDYSYVEDTSSLPDDEATGFSGAICTSGSLLVTRTTCPSDDGFVLSYTAEGDTLTLFEETEELRFHRR